MATSLDKLLKTKSYNDYSIRNLIFKKENQLELIKEAKLLVTTALNGTKSIYEILLEQKKLAIEAMAGDLSDEYRYSIDGKFDSNSYIIDLLSIISNYKNIRLLDGSLYPFSKLTTQQSEHNSIAASSTLKINKASWADGDTLTIAGVTFTFKHTMTNVPTDIDLTTNSVAGNVEAIKNAIHVTLNTLSPAYAAQKNALSSFNFQFNPAVGCIHITAKNAGIEGNYLTVSATMAAAYGGDVTLNGLELQGGEARSFISGSGIGGINGDLHAGIMSSATNAYNGSETTITMGFVSDTILTHLNQTNANNTGVNTAGISNNKKFLGKIQGFQADYNNVPGFVDMQIKVGDYYYVASKVNTFPRVDTIVRFSALPDINGSAGGYFDLQFAAANNSGAFPVTDQTEAYNFAARVDAAFNDVEFFQKRNVAFPNPAGILLDSKFQLISSDFDKLEIENIEIKAPATIAHNDNATIKITINGEVYISGYDKTGSVEALGSLISPYKAIGLVSTKNPTKVLIFTNGRTKLDLGTYDKAHACELAFANGFYLNLDAGISLIEDDNYNLVLQIPGLRTHDLYNYLSIFTKDGALDAISQIYEAQDKLEDVIDNLNWLSLKANLTEGSLKSDLEMLKSYNQNNGNNNVDCKCIGEMPATAVESVIV